jgi:hypothetical protein
MKTTISTNERRKVSIDIAGAYLNADVGVEEIMMRLDPLMAYNLILCKIDPKCIQFPNDGTMIVKMKKYISMNVSKVKYNGKHQ